MRKLIDWILNLLFPLPDIEGNWTNVRMRRLLGPIEGKGDDVSETTIADIKHGRTWRHI